jgi:hypothetical protein
VTTTGARTASARKVIHRAGMAAKLARVVSAESECTRLVFDPRKTVAKCDSLAHTV